MALVGADGKIRHVNSSLERLTGLNSRELRQLRFLRVTLPEYRPLLMKNLGLLSTNACSRVVTRCKLAIDALSGEWIDVAIEKINGMSNDCDFLVSLLRLRDIDTVESADSRVISLVSHEMRTPITSLKGNLAIHKFKLGAHSHDLGSKELEAIERSIEKLTKVSEDILKYSEVESFSFDIEFQELNLIDELRELCDDFRSLAIESEMTISLHSDNPRILVNLDPFRLGQALSNFLSNSLKYCPPGSCIEIFIEETPDSVVLTVKDDGPGIPSDVKSRIFEAFNRSSETVYNQPSTGLGLRIAKQLINAMGGQVEFLESCKAGAAYRLVFPTAKETRI